MHSLFILPLYLTERSDGQVGERVAQAGGHRGEMTYRVKSREYLRNPHAAGGILKYTPGGHRSAVPAAA